MSLPMLETLRTETASINMSLHRQEGPDKIPVPLTSGKCYPPSSEFVYLRTKVTNLSRMCVSLPAVCALTCPQVTSQVFTVDFDFQSSPHVIFEGLLRDVPIGRLETGESREVETGVCFLSYGRFEISAEAKVVGFAESKGTGRLTAMVRAEG
jgi:hypothetical protein